MHVHNSNKKKEKTQREELWKRSETVCPIRKAIENCKNNFKV